MYVFANNLNPGDLISDRYYSYDLMLVISSDIDSFLISSVVRLVLLDMNGKIFTRSYRQNHRKITRWFP